MDALTWGPRFVSGLEELDSQHRRLVGLSNQLGEAVARHAEVPRGHLVALFEELAAYARTHFADEESLMASTGLDGRFQAAHQAQHGRFLRDVEQMQAARFLEAPDTARVLLRFLLHWLAFHILGTDQQLARQVHRLRRGETAELAFRAEVHDEDATAGLLLGALDELTRVLGQRNRELEEANAGLEARVTERTRSLSEALDALRGTQVKLVESEKLASVGLLASGLAHEINNPLAYVTANLSALAEHATALLAVVDGAGQLGPEARREVEAVREDLPDLVAETEEGLQRVRGIVQDLKAFSHVDGGALAELDLSAAAETAVRVLPRRLKEGVAIAAELAEVPRVRCRAAQVSQAILNLLLNAVQAVRDRGQGEVAVRTGKEGDEVFVEVADTGVGMSAEVLSHAFEPFFTTRPPGQGTGLGLTTAYNCAQHHGGNLDARSEPGAGSTFRLSLPLVAREPDGAPTGYTNPFNLRRAPATR